jgi:hypothetical protein
MSFKDCRFQIADCKKLPGLEICNLKSAICNLPGGWQLDIDPKTECNPQEANFGYSRQISAEATTTKALGRATMLVASLAPMPSRIATKGPQHD